MKKQQKKLAIFEGQKIRRIWDEKEEKWYFSVVDIVAVLTDQPDQLKARKYWNKLAERLKKEGSQSVTNCHQLKFMANDGKYYLSDAADTETTLRLIQSIPSPKAEPFKLWLARVGYERVEEISNPEKALNRSRGYWEKMGRSKQWIQQRMMGQEIRNKLTDYWKDNEVKEKIFNFPGVSSAAVYCLYT
jgi:DNA-damage-inducible protein D